jgi:hypothetical protein
VLSEGSSEGLKPRFELLATTAGLALGASLSPNVQPVEYWLDHLWLDLLENGSNYVFGDSITDVCRASEICCLRLAKAAEEKEALERGEIEASPVVDRAAIARDAVGHPAVGQIIDEGGNHERPSSSPTVLQANTAQKENSEAPNGPDFSTIESRKRAVSEVHVALEHGGVDLHGRHLGRHCRRRPSRPVQVDTRSAPSKEFLHNIGTYRTRPYHEPAP